MKLSLITPADVVPEIQTVESPIGKDEDDDEDDAATKEDDDGVSTKEVGDEGEGGCCVIA